MVPRTVRGASTTTPIADASAPSRSRLVRVRLAPSAWIISPSLTTPVPSQAAPRAALRRSIRRRLHVRRRLFSRRVEALDAPKDVRIVDAPPAVVVDRLE